LLWSKGIKVCLAITIWQLAREGWTISAIVPGNHFKVFAAILKERLRLLA
jgi:hypothetical protein